MQRVKKKSEFVVEELCLHLKHMWESDMSLVGEALSGRGCRFQLCVLSACGVGGS